MKPATRTDYLDRTRRVLRFVQEHLDEPLTPVRLAGVANLSTFTSIASSAAFRVAGSEWGRRRT